jgi:hypothetical protein
MENSKTRREGKNKQMPLHERSSSTRHDVLAELGRRRTWPGHAPESMMHDQPRIARAHSEPQAGRGSRASRPAPGPCPPVQSPRDPRQNETSGSGGGTPSRTLRHQPAAPSRERTGAAQGTARGYIGRAALRSLAFRFYSQLAARLAQARDRATPLASQPASGLRA